MRDVFANGGDTEVPPIKGDSMADKELKRLRRSELIEIIYRLKKSEQALAAQVETLQELLRDKNIKLEKAGNVAEAALLISDVFASAQSAADIYLEEIKKRYAAAEEECRRMTAEAREKADALLASAILQKENAENGSAISCAGGASEPEQNAVGKYGEASGAATGEAAR